MIVHIGIGSNLGERQNNCLKALEIMKEKGIMIKKTSSYYETEPWGIEAQPRFINSAIEAETSSSPEELLDILKDIEENMGRIKTVKWGPRIIDLDILFYGDKVIKTEQLQIPHPLLHERDFVLVPLDEISPYKIHPVLGKTVRQLKEELKHEDIKCQKQDKD